jgi:SagB-type dehydrogenase family enzyme
MARDLLVQIKEPVNGTGMTLMRGSAGAVVDAEVVRLPARSLKGRMSVEETLERRRSVREFAPAPLRLSEVAQLLWAAQGITSPEGGRTAPSAGALYPLEIHVVVGQVIGLAAGVYRYRPSSHTLVRLAEGDRRARLARAAHDQDWVGRAPAILVVAGVYERTTVKYGRRGRDYVLMETGHAAQNVSLESVALGLGTTVVGAIDEAAVPSLLDIPPGEVPLCLLPIGQKP